MYALVGGTERLWPARIGYGHRTSYARSGPGRTQHHFCLRRGILRLRDRHPAMTGSDSSGEAPQRRRRWIWVVAGLAVIGFSVAVRFYDPELAAMRREPILEPPPGAVELGRSEQESQTFLLPVEAQVEVAWGLPGTIEDATRWYLDRYADMYSLQPRLRVVGWSGGRSVEPGFGVGASVTLCESLDAVEWTDFELEEQAKASSWDGVVAVVRVS